MVAQENVTSFFRLRAGIPIGLLLVAFPAVHAAAREPDATVAGSISGAPSRFRDETVVYIVDAPAATAPRTHRLDQKGMRFLPHVLVIARGDSVEFLNHDVVDHNIFSPDNEGYNIGIFQHGQTRSYVFETTGPYLQLCNLHQTMLGYIFVTANRYAATVDAEGRFAIPKVPPGTYRLAVWNSHAAAPEQTVAVAAGKTTRASFVLNPMR